MTSSNLVAILGCAMAISGVLADAHGPPRRGRALDRVDQPVAPHSEIEIDVERAAATERVGSATVGLGDVERLPARHAVRGDAVLGRYRHERQGILAAARPKLTADGVERALRAQHYGALTSVDLDPVAARIRRHGSDGDRRVGAARQPADHVETG